MANTGFQDSAYSAYLSQIAGQFQQVVASINSVKNTMDTIVAAQTRLTASLTTPDPSFGTAIQGDIDTLNTWLAQWTTVNDTPASFQQAVAAFLASPPQV